ncbi:MAG: hypothetical protein ACE5DM_02055 [Candidatus Nanoarchaeia archaeon]
MSDIPPPKSSRSSDLTGIAKVRYICDQLRELRQGYRNTIPPVPIGSTNKIRNYKCRASWWTVLRYRFDQLNQEGVLSEALCKKYLTLTHDHSEAMKLERMDMDREEIKTNIDEANALIDEVLGTLEGRLDIRDE